MTALEQKELEEELMVALRSMRPQERFAAEEPVLVGDLRVGGNRVRHAKPA